MNNHQLPFSLARRLFIVLAIIACPALSFAVNNDECMECHSDDSLARSESQGIKEKLYLDANRFSYSVHNVNGIGCVDCHADIEKLDYSTEVPHSTSLAAVNCSSCHEAEGEAYMNSVHRKAQGKGINIPCYACHEYHYVERLEGASVTERENAFCLKCHNADKFHDWLPQKQTHFDFVECTVCHAPDAPRHIKLRFFDLVKSKFLTGDQILEALNTDMDGFLPLIDTSKDNMIGVTEFENMLLLLRQKGLHVTVHGELASELQPVIHHVNRGQANRDCATCHQPSSPFFESVNISLAQGNREVEHYGVERAVLETYHVNHFYALGGTRVRLLDKIGFGLLAGGAGVVVGHLSVRLLTIPARRKKNDPYGS